MEKLKPYDHNNSNAMKSFEELTNDYVQYVVDAIKKQKPYDHKNNNAMESCGLNPKLIDECVGLVTEAITEETKWSRTVEKVEKYITDEKIPIRAIVYLLCFTILEHLEDKSEKSKGV